jgi:hypothetical protein
VTTQITAALRACAAGFYSGEAGTELLISHGGFLHRPDFSRFVDTFASITDSTPMAQIDWESVHSACCEGQLPLSGGEWRILKIAASLAAGTGVSLRDTLPGLDDRNLELVTTAIRHAAGHRPPHPPHP